MTNNKTKKTNSGYSLIETLFYIFLFTILSITVTNSIITMLKSFKEISIQREITQGGEMMERISREIRQAHQITSLNSPSDLIIETKDEVGANKAVEFTLQDQNIRLLEAGSFTSNLNSPNIKVTSLVFTQVNTIKGKAIKIFLTISSKHDSLSRNYEYYNTVVLRGDY